MTNQEENDQNSIFIGHSHSFDVGIAKNLGVTAAIVFNHIVYWLRINVSKQVNLIEGKIWMYESQKEIADFLEYLSLEEVKKSIVKLLDSGLLIKGNFNKNPFDKTNWYTTSDQSIIQKSFTKAPYSAIDKATRRHPESPTAPSIYDKEDKHKEHSLKGSNPEAQKPESKPTEQGVIFPKEWQFLTPIEISDKEKSTLMKHYSPEHIQRVLEYVNHPDFLIQTTLSQVIFHYAKNPDHMKQKEPEKIETPLDLEEQTIQNRLKAENYCNDNRKNLDFPVCDFHFIEFRHLGTKLAFADKQYSKKFADAEKAYEEHLKKPNTSSRKIESEPKTAET